MECWASSLGDCSTKASREHLVTDGIWAGPDIEVVGLPWCRHVPVKPGRASLVSKVLCSKHNSALSVVDSAAIAAFRALRSAAELVDVRRKHPIRGVVPRCFAVDGDLLERWFIKTCINLALVQQGAVSWFGGKPGRVPPAGIVAAAFGRERLPRGAGLYAAASVGEQGFGSESVHFAPLFDSEDRMPGAIFKFYGFRFLLSFRPGMLPARVSIGDDRESPWHATELLYHIERARFTIGNELSHWVYFEWPEKLSAHYRE